MIIPPRRHWILACSSITELSTREKRHCDSFADPTRDLGSLKFVNSWCTSAFFGVSPMKLWCRMNPWQEADHHHSDQNQNLRCLNDLSLENTDVLPEKKSFGGIPNSRNVFYCYKSFWSVLRSQALEPSPEPCWTWPGCTKTSHPNLLGNLLRNRNPVEPDLAAPKAPRPSPELSPEPCWTWPGSAPKPPGTFSGTFSGTLLNLAWLHFPTPPHTTQWPKGTNRRDKGTEVGDRRERVGWAGVMGGPFGSLFSPFTTHHATARRSFLTSWARRVANEVKRRR